MVFLVIGLSAGLTVLAGLLCWLLAAGDRRLARARRSLAEEHATRRRVGL